MAIWSRLGMSGQAAAAGAAVIVIVIGGIYVVTQRRDVVPPDPAPTAAQEAAAGAVAEILNPAPTSDQVDVGTQIAASEAVSEPAPEPKPDPEPDPEPAPEPEQTPEPEQAPTPEAGAQFGVAVAPAPDTSPAPAAEPEPEPKAAPEPASDPEPVAVARAPEDPAPAKPADPKPPAFDLVQVAPDGGGVIAGTGAPGSEVLFLLDGTEVARGRADRSGKFGVLLDFPASDTPRALSMVTVLADGRRVASEGTVLISPVQQAAPEAPEAPDEAEQPVQTAQADTPPEEAAPAQADAPTQPPQTDDAAQDAPAVVLADTSGVTVLQPAPRPAAPKAEQDAPVTANVVIDTISYDAEGDVALAGRGAAQGFVRVYLNDKPVKTTRIAEDGAWQAPLPDIDAGVYRLRVDEVDADGAVTSRVETPFQREAPEVATAAPQAATAVTVQPGFTLWAIARDRFGAGEQYVRVYEANRDLIRDPDLIYPGQVFALPAD